MSWNGYFIIAVLFSCIVLSVVSLFLAPIKYESVYSKKYSFKRNFSFESHNFKTDNFLIIYRIIFVMALVCPILMFIPITSADLFKSTFGIDLFSSLLFLSISCVFQMFLFFTKTLNIKIFVSLFVGRMFSLLAASGSLLIGFTTKIFSDSFKLSVSNPTPYYVIYALLCFFLLIYFVLFMNPRFYKWYEMDINEKGEAVRPAILWLAFYEWIINFLSVLFASLIAACYLITILVY